MAAESRMTHACRTKSDNGGAEAAALRSSGRSNSSSSSSSSSSARRRHRRRPFRAAAAAAAAAMALALFAVGLVQRIEMAVATDDVSGFGYGDPIDVVVTSGDEIVLDFHGDAADAISVSIQQCTGNEYVRVAVYYDTHPDNFTTSGDRLEGSMCTRIIGGGTSSNSSDVSYNKLCGFKNSGPVELVYTEETQQLSGTVVNSLADPTLLKVLITNTGPTTATVQVVLFTSDDPAPNEDSSIDRVHTKSDQDENTYTVDASFQAEGSTDTFCDEGVCAVYAYYIEINDDDTQADLLFGTTCQARAGVMVYEGFTTVSTLVGSDDESDESDGDGDNDDDVETAALAGATAATTASTTPYDLNACTEFPKNTAASYRVYLVVSPDTATASRVGYGLRDQLLYESEEIRVEDDMDALCPEIVVEDTSGAARTFGAAAVPGGAAAAATATVSGVVAVVFGAVFSA